MSVKASQQPANGVGDAAAGAPADVVEATGDMVSRGDASPPIRPRGAPRARPLSLPGLVAIIYYSVCGGPFGTEDVVSAAGPLFALVGFLVMPLVWSVPEALVAAELATAFPSNSGYVMWVTAAFGPFWGFLEGFLSWLCGVFDSAIYPVLFRDYLKHLVPGVGHGIVGYIFVVTLSVVLSLLNFRGLNIVGLSALVLALFTISPFIYIVPVGLLQIEPKNLLIMPDSLANVNWTNYLNVLFWNLNYWDTASTLAGEVRDPQHTFPRALLATALLVFASYLLPLMVGIGVGGKDGQLKWREWRSGSLASVGFRTGGEVIKGWVVAAAAVSNIGQFVSEQAACSFQLLGMAERGFLPTAFAARSRYSTPTLGIGLCLLIVLSLATFDFEAIVDLLNGIYCLAQLLEFAAFLHLRKVHPSLRRPFSVPLRSVASCVVLLSAPMGFCVILIVLPFVTKNWTQVGVLFATPIIGMLLYKLLEISRRRAWLTFSCSPPQSLAEVLAMQTPLHTFGTESRSVSSGMEEILLPPPERLPTLPEADDSK